MDEGLSFSRLYPRSSILMLAFASTDVFYSEYIERSQPN